MLNAPSTVDERQLRELHLTFTADKQGAGGRMHKIRRRSGGATSYKRE